MSALDDIEINLRKAAAEAAQHEAARLRDLVTEIRDALHAPGSADDKVAWLIERLS